MTGRGMGIAYRKFESEDWGIRELSGGHASQEGFLKRISLRLFCNKNESETRRAENNRMMSRLSRIEWRPEAVPLRIAGISGLCRPEEPEQHTFRPKQSDQLSGERLRRASIEVIDEIPAEDAVDGFRQFRKPIGKKLRKCTHIAAPLIPVEVREDVLDVDLALELLTEKADV